MSDRTGIEWTDATWNPVTGCTRVSPGCAHCYIERTPPFRMEGRRFARVGDAETTGVRLHPERLDQPLRWRKPRRVFVCSMGDLFHEQVPDHFVAGVFAVMSQAREHTFQLLTKRPERALDLLGEWCDHASHAAASGSRGPTPVHWQRWQHGLPNVWVGVSIENARHTWRADVLREIPAAVRFISAEPLLGSLLEHERQPCPTPSKRGTWCECRAPLDLAGIDWLICGGESGPGARPMRLDWVRELRDGCQAAGVPFFLKQLGGHPNARGHDAAVLDGRRWTDTPDLEATP